MANQNNYNNEVLLVDDVSKWCITDKDIVENPEIIIDNLDKKTFLIPALGRREWDGHIYVCGATGSGKSYIIRKIIDNDAKKRLCILFTDLENKDPAFQGMNYIKFNEKDPKYNAQWLQKNKAKKILIFDDVQFNEDILHFRDKMIEKGRHSDTVVICVNHKMLDWQKTKVPLTDCRFMICFPGANRGTCVRMLKDDMEMDKKQIKEIIDQTMSDGRQLIIHRFYPNFVASAKTIWKA